MKSLDDFDIPDDATLDLGIDDAVYEAAEREAARVEYAIRGAIRAGYDGVDINHPPPHDLSSFGVASIIPWRYPAPEGANGCRTARYTWDWFSEAELTEILNGETADALAGLEEGRRWVN